MCHVGGRPCEILQDGCCHIYWLPSSPRFPWKMEVPTNVKGGYPLSEVSATLKAVLPSLCVSKRFKTIQACFAGALTAKLCCSYAGRGFVQMA